MHEKYEIQTLIAVAATRTADGSGTGIDVSAYTGEVIAVLQALQTAGSSPTLDVIVEESDSLSTGYTAVSGLAFTQVTTTASHQKLQFNVDKLKKYIRLTWDIGGTSTPSYLISASLLAAPKYQT